jgi:hypothetical protein
VYARVLVKIYPGKKDAIEKRANQIGQDRILAGYHYPSDVDAGNAFGDTIYEKLAANAAFKSAFEKALQNPN